MLAAAGDHRARVRLVTQLCKQAPPPVWEIFDAAWNRATFGCELLADACRCVLPAVAELTGVKHIHLQAIRQHILGFLKACKHLSRYGTIYWAFWELWRDVGFSRRKTVIGVPGHFPCPLCQVVLPSLQALAAHTHRKHTVVNCLTRLTHGTVCLWCHTEQFSTDRLKYHLRKHPLCVHGLRVTVGECYEYGTGSRRTGCRGHRGLPPQRLPGPLNATPVMRAAAAAGRAASAAELLGELFAATGSYDVMQWPAPSRAGLATSDPISQLESNQEAPSSQHIQPTPVPQAINPTETPVKWRQFCDYSSAARCYLPSPRWEGLHTEIVCWGLPSAWHHYWPLWLTTDANAQPWDCRNRRAQRLLRHAASPEATRTGPSLVELAANTVTFKQICSAVRLRGLLWITGVPSSPGLILLRRMLPSAIFHVYSLASRRVFVASHRSFDVSGRLADLASIVDSSECAFSFDGRFLQPSLIYHPSSLDGS